MIRLLLLLALWVPGLCASADKWTFDFDHVKLSSLATMIYTDVLHSSFVFDADFVKDETVVSLRLKEADKSQVQFVLDGLLKAHGFKGVVLHGMSTVVRDREEERDLVTFFYRPKNRSVQYLADLVQGLLPKGKFSFNRGGQVSGGVYPIPPGEVEEGGAAGPVGGPRGAVGRSSKNSAASGGVGSTRIEADAFYFTGSALDVEKLKALLVEVDTAPIGVLVKAMVYEVSGIERDSSAVGIAATILGQRFGVHLGDAGASSYSVFAKLGGVDAVFSALSSDSRFKSLASPSLRVSSGASARVTVGSEVPVLGSVSVSGNGIATQAVSYRPSGLMFDVKPVVLLEQVEMTIFQQSSSFIVTTTGVNSTPTLQKRELTTQVNMPYQSFVVLGGLEENTDTGDVSGMSFLPDWLRSRSGVKSKTEVLIVLYTERV